MDIEAARRRGRPEGDRVEAEVAIHAGTTEVVIELNGALDQPMADAVTLAATAAMADGREVLLDVGGLRDADAAAIRTVACLLALDDDEAEVRMRGTWPGDEPVTRS